MYHQCFRILSSTHGYIVICLGTFISSVSTVVLEKAGPVTITKWSLEWCEKESLTNDGLQFHQYQQNGGYYGLDCMVVRFTTTCAISAYHH